MDDLFIIALMIDEIDKINGNNKKPPYWIYFLIILIGFIGMVIVSCL